MHILNMYGKMFCLFCFAQELYDSYKNYIDNLNFVIRFEIWRRYIFQREVKFVQHNSQFCLDTLVPT